MKDYIEERVMTIAAYIIENKATVRQSARRFGVSKTTVHKDMRDRLPLINPGLAGEIGRILQFNKADRHIRGGEATRLKYLDRKRACAGPVR